MLVLSRKKSQVIQLGEDVEITVLEIRGNIVRLGLTAPKSIPIVRKELVEPEHQIETTTT